MAGCRAAIFQRMLFSTPRLRALEAAFRREAFASLSYEDALARFASLWAE